MKIQVIDREYDSWYQKGAIYEACMLSLQYGYLIHISEGECAYIKYNHATLLDIN
jgi:hypothetical protein